MRGFWLITLPLFGIDQITKLLAYWNLAKEPLPVIPGFFTLELAFNTGAAFGMLKDNNLFFILLSIVAALVILWLQVTGKFDQPRPMWVAGWLLLAGVLGNLTDRIWNRAVIDFLRFDFGQFTWPNFNVADSCICISVGLIMIASLIPESKAGGSGEGNEAAPEEAEQSSAPEDRSGSR